MKVLKVQRVLFVIAFLAIAAALGFIFWSAPEMEWSTSPRWQLLAELLGACVAVEVAAFALSRFGLERRRLPMFIGLAYLGAAVADLCAAVVAQGYYLMPLIGRTYAVVGVWTAGRLWLAVFLNAGLFVERRAPMARSARSELIPAIVAGAATAFALAQMLQMIALPGLVRDAGAVHRPWELVIAALMAAAVPGYWLVYRRLGGSMIGSVLVSLVLGLFAQVYMARSAVLYDGLFNLASVLKIASYIPLLIGLFVESVTLFRAQKRLTSGLQVAEAELREYSKSLETKVAERTHALEARSKELEAFAYTVSHDLKAPLRGIMVYSQFLLEQYGAKLDEEGHRYIASMAKAANNMRTLIDDLLEYSRLERREAEMGPVDLRSLTDSIIEERQTQIQESRAQVELDLALPTLTGDRAMLRLALANLVDNALKFSRNSNPPHIRVSGREQNGHYIVCVSDNGIGFDMQYRDRIFEIFQRLHRQEEYEGTGIGLTTVKRAVEKHGGKVTAESKPGCGAQFTFTIPKQETKP
jgi:signal transduction histidine kinase